MTLNKRERERKNEQIYSNNSRGYLPTSLTSTTLEDLSRKILVAERKSEKFRKTKEKRNETRLSIRTFLLLGRRRSRRRGRRRRRHRHRRRSRRRGHRGRSRRRGGRRRRRWRWRWWLLLLVTCHRLDGHRGVDRVGLRRSADRIGWGVPRGYRPAVPCDSLSSPRCDLYLCLSRTPYTSGGT